MFSFLSDVKAIHWIFNFRCFSILEFPPDYFFFKFLDLCWNSQSWLLILWHNRQEVFWSLCLITLLTEYPLGLLLWWAAFGGSSPMVFFLDVLFWLGAKHKNGRQMLRIWFTLPSGSQHKAWDVCQGTSSLAGLQVLCPPQPPGLLAPTLRTSRHY